MHVFDIICRFVADPYIFVLQIYRKPEKDCTLRGVHSEKQLCQDLHIKRISDKRDWSVLISADVMLC